MLAGLLALELLSIGLFALLLLRQQTQETSLRAHQRLAYEAKSLALQSTEALEQQRPGWIGLSVNMMGDSPTIAQAKVTDPAGNVLFISKGEADESTLDPIELQQIPQTKRDAASCLTLSGGRWECVYPIYTADSLRGFAWVTFDKRWVNEQIGSIIRGTAIFGVIWVFASAVLVLLMSRSIAQPLSVLHRGAAVLMNSPEVGSHFPLPCITKSAT
jgi:hypothetical protein